MGNPHIPLLWNHLSRKTRGGKKKPKMFPRPIVPAGKKKKGPTGGPLFKTTRDKPPYCLSTTREKRGLTHPEGNPQKNKAPKKAFGESPPKNKIKAPKK